MRHLVLLLVIALGGYFGWAYTPRSAKRAAQKILRRHAFPVATILLFLIAALVVMFYNGSINLL